MGDDSYSANKVAEHLCGDSTWSNAIAALYTACDNNKRALFKLFGASTEDFENKEARTPEQKEAAKRYICWLITGSAPVPAAVPVSAPVRAPGAVRVSAQPAPAQSASAPAQPARGSAQPRTSRRMVWTQAERPGTESVQVHAAKIARKLMYYKTVHAPLVQWRRDNVTLSLFADNKTITSDYAHDGVVPEVAAVEPNGISVKLFADGTMRPESESTGVSALCAWYHALFGSKSSTATADVPEDVLIMCIMAGVSLDDGRGEIFRGALLAVQTL